MIGLLQYFGVVQWLSPWVNSTALGEAYANLRQRNQFASLTNIGLAALLWWVARAQSKSASSDSPSRGTSFNWPSAAPVAAAVLLAIGNAASSSRTGLVQLAMLVVMVLIWGGWRQPDTRRVMLVAALTYCVAALALPALAGLDPQATGILARLHAGDSVCASRLTLWRNVLHLIAEKPWFGWGWGELDYAHFITLYPGPRFCEILDNAHNLPLHLAVELGVPLALAVCGGGLWLVWRAKPWRETDATRQMAWTVLAVILLHSMLEYPLWYGPFQMAFGLCIALLWTTRPVRSALAAKKAEPSTHENRALARGIRMVVALVLMMFTAYAAWDYHRVSQIYLIPKMRSEAYRDNTLAKVRDSRLFQNQVRFAELTTTRLTIDNAAHINDLAKAVLHFSPEPRVIEKLIESAVLLRREEEASYYLVRYRAAFPESHARWEKNNANTKM
ncbi:Wzy polymerase domain-containing protein [Rhodoferax sp.]|uniref:Wzy polymerase domain-containing protein n=1 Tax=Rhodoferax sp. TaxID=50421 RepID=UPI00271F486E|nr:Wzy polymerase domain-containing protein [Rhodoferax sp.]MDO9199528.1 Wzy polymerase domain-containing protein [Rhodoferax sp.]